VEPRRQFSSWALGLLIATVAVILWGAWVRVTGSGAGCADHWPLCNGELVPRSPRVETLIELTHRVTSGLAGLLAVAVFWLSRRRLPRGDPARTAAAIALVLMVLEAAIGALLVKKGLVGKDASQGRAWVVALHLCNTFLLVGAQVATYQLGRRPQPVVFRGQGVLALQLGAALLGLLLLGASGAVTALGDTLFPAASLREGMAQDLSAQAHFLVRLRIYHPLLAVLIGGFVVYVAQSARAQHADYQPSGNAVARWAMRLTFLYLAQVALGSLNLLLLAPAAIQVAHLLLADLTWIACVQLGLALADQRAIDATGAQVSLESAAS
jgi:cytochrome c oxidase assembly protein subunit 15